VRLHAQAGGIDDRRVLNTDHGVRDGAFACQPDKFAGLAGVRGQNNVAGLKKLGLNPSHGRFHDFWNARGLM
jgi:hypothetical protein